MNNTTVVGWQEWCALPDLAIPAIKAKVDSGAKTSALHAYQIEPYQRRGHAYVRFHVHPLQHNNDIVVACHASVLDQRTVTSSNGQKERRYVIASRCIVGHLDFTIDITLTSRDMMTFRMLLGRDALRQLAVIDPAHTCCLGKISKKKALQIYAHSS
jgi:ribosomal protein S6--L-glutamate ligase